MGRALFPNGPIEIAELLMKEWEDQLSVDVKLEELQNKQLDEQVFYVLQKRLSYEIPYLPNWEQAMKLGLLPPNVSTVYNRLFSTMNTVWEMVGDKSEGVMVT